MVLALALVVLATACSSASDPSLAVADVAEDYLTVVYDDVTSQLPALAAAVEEACLDRSPTTLDAVRSSWTTTQAVWKTSQAGWFGPTTMDRHDSSIGQEPASPEGIEATLASDASFDAAYVSSSLPTTQRGLAAVEYIVFGEAELDDRRCEYVTAVADALSIESDDLQESWFTSWDGGSAFIDRFTGSAEPAMSSRDALGDQVGAILELLKLLTLQQLGRELGITSPTPVAGAYPEGAAEFGLASLRSQVAGLGKAYGVAPASISGAIATRSSDVDANIQSSIVDAVTLIDAIVADQGGTSMATAVSDDFARLEEVYQILAELRRAFATDVVSLLDITVGFSDSDGDTG